MADIFALTVFFMFWGVGLITSAFWLSVTFGFMWVFASRRVLPDLSDLFHMAIGPASLFCCYYLFRAFFIV
jgi:hypothetical protein